MPTVLTSNQKRGLFAAWGGVALDGVDSFIYALVLVPAMRDLLPRSGIAPTTGNLGLYGSILFAAFLIGWGLAFVWGPLADRYGRVRMLMLAIVCYSLFTFLGAFAHRWWMLAVFRLLAGFGIGGEFVGAATFVAEELPESRRVLGAGIMNSGYYVGNLIAAILNYTVGASYGWRVMFAIGGLPALFVAYVRASVKEPERWRNRRQQIGPWRARDAFLLLFSPEYRRHSETWSLDPTEPEHKWESSTFRSLLTTAVNSQLQRPPQRITDGADLESGGWELRLES